MEFKIFKEHHEKKQKKKKFKHKKLVILRETVLMDKSNIPLQNNGKKAAWGSHEHHELQNSGCTYRNTQKHAGTSQRRRGTNGERQEALRGQDIESTAPADKSSAAVVVMM